MNGNGKFYGDTTTHNKVELFRINNRSNDLLLLNDIPSGFLLLPNLSVLTRNVRNFFIIPCVPTFKKNTIGVTTYLKS